MTCRLLLIGMLVMPVVGCDADRSVDCRWPTEAASRLNLDRQADARHLLDDVRLAEDLAIRYGDVRWGPGPVRWQLRDERCLNPTLSQIATRHGIPLESVVAARASLDDPRGFDPLVDIPIVLFAAGIGWLAVRRVTRRFPLAEEWWANTVAFAFVAVLIGGVTLAFGRLWEGGIAAARLGTDHLTYRGLRLHWTRHPVALAALGTVIAWAVGLVHQRQRRSN